METDQIKEKLAKLFSDRRKELGLTLLQVEALGDGFNYQSVYRLEKMNLRLRPSVLRRIAKALNFEIPADLIPETEPHKLSRPQNTELGKQLVKKRLELEISQLNLATMLGVSSRVIGGIENGTYKASKRLQNRIAKFIQGD